MIPRCKICRHPEAGAGLIKGAVDGWTPSDAYRYGAQFNLTFSEPTWYLHVKHAKEAAAAPPPDLNIIPASSNTELLEAVRDFAMQEVKKGHIGALKDGLRAVQILEARKGQDDARGFLSLLTTGHAPRIQVMDDIPDTDDQEI